MRKGKARTRLLSVKDGEGCEEETEKRVLTVFLRLRTSSCRLHQETLGSGITHQR